MLDRAADAVDERTEAARARAARAAAEATAEAAVAAAAAATQKLAHGVLDGLETLLFGKVGGAEEAARDDDGDPLTRLRARFAHAGAAEDEGAGGAAGTPADGARVGAARAPSAPPDGGRAAASPAPGTAAPAAATPAPDRPAAPLRRRTAREEAEAQARAQLEALKAARDQKRSGGGADVPVKKRL